MKPPKESRPGILTEAFLFYQDKAYLHLYFIL